MPHLLNNTMNLDENTEYNKFSDFEFSDSINKGIKEAGFQVPSPIQSKTIPIIMQGKDIIAQAHTGTGKTAAFGLPSMDRLAGTRGVGMLIITPTRELATQLGDELYRLGRHAGIQTVTVYGGNSYGRQISLISRGAQVVVATPGRLKDLLKNRNLKNFNPKIVVLDEADEMLDMGFLDDIKEIFTYLPDERQTLLFSATIPKPIKSLADRILKKPISINVIPKDSDTHEDIAQRYFVIEEYERDDAITRLIEHEDPVKSIIFCRTKKEVDRLSTLLVSRGYAAKGLHGDMEQPQREEVIKSFRKGNIDTLIATDVAARGLDITDVSHVFNFHIPFDKDSYVHRIGRTGRAGRKGDAITLVTPLELKELLHIKSSVGKSLEIATIPSITQVRSKELSRIVEKIKVTKILDEATEIYVALEEEIDSSQITIKAISLLLEKEEVDGPNEIGFTKAQVEKLIKVHRSKGRLGGSKKRYSGRGRSSDQRNRGSRRRSRR